MGQYHEIWAFDPAKEAPPETIDHYAFGAGAKLAEQGYCFPMVEGNPTPVASPYSAAVGLLLMGRWANRRVIVIGDYAEDDMVPAFDEQFALSEYYGATPTPGEYDSDRPINGTVLDISQQAMNLLAEASGWTFTKDRGWNEIIQPDDFAERVEQWSKLTGPPHVIASGNGEFLRPAALLSPENALAMPYIGGAFSAVIALLACSDGLGGGDFCMEPAGRWAYTNVSILDARKTGGMTDITDWLVDQEEVTRWVREGAAR